MRTIALVILAALATQSSGPYAELSARRLETLQLVRQGKFDAVEKIVAPVEDAFERNQADELAVVTAFAPFTTADDLGPQLERWAASAPKSFAARLAYAKFLRRSWHLHDDAQRSHAPTALDSAKLDELAQRAVAEYHAALALRPKLVTAWSDLMELAFSMRDGALLRDASKQGLAQVPASFQLRENLLTWGLVREQDFDAFFADAEQHAAENPALRRLPASLEISRAKGLWMSRQLPQALAIFETQTRAFDVFDWQKERARLLRVLGRFAEARTAIDHALALMPGKPDGWAERGWLEVDTKRYAEARADFQKAAALEPFDREINRGLGTALENLGDVPGAIAAYRLSADWYGDAAVLHSLGWLELNKANDARAAVASFDRALALDPRDRWSWFDRGEALDALGDPRAPDSFARYVALAGAGSGDDKETLPYAKGRVRGVPPPRPTAPPPLPPPAAAQK
jgi:tetratricopeptide (TPR) repeat protein